MTKTKVKGAAPTRASVTASNSGQGAHPSWAAQVNWDDPRIEAMCLRFCEMGGISPNNTDTDPAPGYLNWQSYALAMAQYLEAADKVDPLRQS